MKAKDCPKSEAKVHKGAGAQFLVALDVVRIVKLPTSGDFTKHFTLGKLYLVHKEDEHLLINSGGESNVDIYASGPWKHPDLELEKV